jgi:DNA-binding transcriptional LysR family regulator
MELRQLEYFLAVAEEANFTRAAARVHISQSGVSAQVARLERELGTTLIDRSGRTATLTAAGAAVLDHARQALDSAEAVRQTVQEINGLLRGRLTLGMVTGCTITPLFDAVSDFAAAHPGVELSLLEDSSDQLVDSVRAGEIDAALIGTAATELPELTTQTIISEPIVAAVAASGHPLSTRSRARLQEITAYPIICMPSGTGIRAVLELACAAQGLPVNVALEASAPDAVLDLARRGVGVAVLSASMLAGRDDLATIAIQDVQTNANLSLVWTPGPGPALRKLLDLVHAAFGLATPTHAPAPPFG